MTDPPVGQGEIRGKSDRSYLSGSVREILNNLVQWEDEKVTEGRFNLIFNFNSVLPGILYQRERGRLGRSYRDWSTGEVDRESKRRKIGRVGGTIRNLSVGTRSPKVERQGGLTSWKEVNSQTDRESKKVSKWVYGRTSVCELYRSNKFERVRR